MKTHEEDGEPPWQVIFLDDLLDQVLPFLDYFWWKKKLLIHFSNIILEFCWYNCLTYILNKMPKWQYKYYATIKKVKDRALAQWRIKIYIYILRYIYISNWKAMNLVISWLNILNYHMKYLGKQITCLKENVILGLGAENRTL